MALALKGRQRLVCPGGKNIGGTPHVTGLRLVGMGDYHPFYDRKMYGAWKPVEWLNFPNLLKVLCLWAELCRSVLYCACLFSIAPLWLPPNHSSSAGDEGRGRGIEILMATLRRDRGYDPDSLPCLASLFWWSCGVKDVDSWAAFWVRTIGVLILRGALLDLLLRKFRLLGTWKSSYGRTFPPIPRWRISGMELLVDYSSSVERMVLP